MPTAKTTTAEVALSAAAPPLAMLGAKRTARFALRGEIGHREATALSARALQLAADGWLFVAVDLARVTHWDYRSLPDIHKLSRQLRQYRGRLSLLSPSRYLATILRFGGLDDLVVNREEQHAGSSEGVDA